MIYMNFSHEEQIEYLRLALAIHSAEGANISALETIVSFGELIKKHASHENAVIYDATEYFYEQLRLARGEDGAYDDTELRTSLEQTIRA